jgi:hypothetical protein
MDICTLDLRRHAIVDWKCVSGRVHGVPIRSDGAHVLANVLWLEPQEFNRSRECRGQF